MIQCVITDRASLPAGVAFLSAIARNLAAGPDWIQIREKDLSARELLVFTQKVLDLPNPRAVKILVNTRVDVALACGAAGAHLPSGSPSPRSWRPIAPLGFLLGVSCHSPEEVRVAAEEGADYVFFGPVFPPLSKSSPLPPVGLAGLAGAVAAASAVSLKIPVLALGGITRSNAASCLETGAGGVAGISLYRDPP